MSVGSMPYLRKMQFNPACDAITLAMSVLPTPEGPCNSTPVIGFKPRRWIVSAFVHCLSTNCRRFFKSVIPPILSHDKVLAEEDEVVEGEGVMDDFNREEDDGLTDLNAS